MTEPNIDDAIRILQESSRRTIEYINELQAENDRLRRALQDHHEKPCNKSCAPGYCYCECPHGVTDGNCKERFAALVAAAEREACAKLCEEPGWNAANWCAKQIRARGEKK